LQLVFQSIRKLIVKHTNITHYEKINKHIGGGHVTPEMEVCSVKAEQGFFVSQNPDLTYGGAGEAGAIGDGNSYEL